MSSTALAVPPGRRQLAPIYAAGFVTAFGAHAVAANLGRVAVLHHDSLWVLGLLLAVYDAAEVVLKPVFGSLVDRKGAKPVMVGGLVAFAVASAAFVAGGNPGLLGAARLAQGAAAAAFSPAASTAVAGFGGRKHTGRLFGGYGGAKSIGHLLGPLIGGLLVTVGGYSLLFTVLAAVAAIGAFAVAAWVPHLPPSAVRSRSSVAGLLRRVSHPDFLRPVLLLAAAAGALSVGVGFFPLLGARHHLGPAATGALVSLLAGAAALVQPWAGRRLDEGRLPAAASSGGLILAAAGFLTSIAVPDVAGIAIAAILVGTGVAITTPIGFTGLAASAPPGRMGKTMGAGEVGRELGDAGGPILVGAFGLISLTAGFAAFAGALLVCGSLGARRPHRRSSVSPVPPEDGNLSQP